MSWFQALDDNYDNTALVMRFKDYVTEIWVEWHLDLWNHFDQNGPRTINAVGEGTTSSKCVAYVPRFRVCRDASEGTGYCKYGKWIRASQKEKASPAGYLTAEPRGQATALNAAPHLVYFEWKLEIFVREQRLYDTCDCDTTVLIILLIIIQCILACKIFNMQALYTSVLIGFC